MWNTNKSLKYALLFICLINIVFTFSNNDTNPTTLIDTTQTHIIRNGSYFQFTFTSMKLQQPQYNTSISQYIVTISLDFTAPVLGSQILYNILVFPQSNPNAQPLYQNYVKAAVEGLPGLMPIFPKNYTDLNGNCQDCYQTAIYSTQPVACLKCNSTSISISLTSEKWAQLQQWNNTVMSVIDNSFVIGPTGAQMLLNMGYEINILYNEEFEALFILFVSVISSLVIILGILAVYLTLRIKKVEEEINSYKSKIKGQ